MDSSAFAASVDGHCVKYDDLAVTISFRSSSDALLAAFVYKHDTLPLDVIDDLITMLRGREFSASQITFHNANDIPRYIAEQRRYHARQRAHKESQSRSSVPQLVIDLVAHQLAQDRLSLDWTASRMFAGRCPSRTALYNMALVHRSWTDTAQHFLHQHIVVVGGRRLRDALENPHIGPWVREFYYGTRSRWDSNTGSRQFAPLLAQVLRICPNIRSLYIHSHFTNTLDRMEFDLVIKELPNLSRLERLFLEHTPSRPGIFADGNDLPNLLLFLQILSRMRALKVLTLHNWVGTRVTTLDPAPSESVLVEEIDAPNATLTSLSYQSRANHGIGTHLLPLLFRPRNGFALTSLELMTWDLFDESSTLLLQAVTAALPNIVNLRLICAMNSEHDLFDFLTNCGRLRRLTIVLDARGLTMAVKPLPNTLEYLWIHYVSWPSPFPDNIGQDECIVQTIGLIPKLKGLTIASSPNGMQDQSTMLTSAFDQTVAYCSKKGIELVVKLTGLPFFE